MDTGGRSTNESSARRSVYERFKEARARSYTVWISDAAIVAFYGYLSVKRDVVAEVLGLDSSAFWKILVLAIFLHFASGPSMGIAIGICHRYTGIIYGEDRSAFALAGGFDVGLWPMRLAQIGLYWTYWWTLMKMAPDPLAVARRPWVYVVASTLIGMALTAIVAVIVFRAYARRHPEILYDNLARRY